MEHFNTVALSVSGLCLAYNAMLTLFRSSTFEVTNTLDTFGRSVTVALVNVSIYALGKNNNGASQIMQAMLVGGVIYLCYRDYQKNVVGARYKSRNLTGKVFIVTGCNTGIGYETAKALLKQGGTVVMACRSTEKANEARDTLLKHTRAAHHRIHVVPLDLCSFHSVREFVEEFHLLGLPLHALINNAGIMMDKRELVKDTNLEVGFTANHLSHFLLTNLLLPDLERTSGRVVTLSSSVHRLAKHFDFDDIMSERYYEMFHCYAQSKLANLLFIRELQNRLTARHSTVTCFAVHPGCVRTDVTRHMNAFMQIGNALCSPILASLQKTPPEGAYTSVHVATCPELAAHPNKYAGKLFFHCELFPVSEAAKDDAAALRLWHLSEELTGLAAK